MSFENTSLRSGQQFRHWLAIFAFSTLPGLMLSQTAVASNITVGSPVSGLRVSSTMWVRAHSTGCDGVRPHKFGYSIDNSQTTIWGVTAYDIDAEKVPLNRGTHTIHFKSWNQQGQLCPVVNTTVIATGVKDPGQGSSGSGSSGDGSGGNGARAVGLGAAGLGAAVWGQRSGALGTRAAAARTAAKALAAAPVQDPPREIFPATRSLPRFWTERAGFMKEIKRYREGRKDPRPIRRQLRCMTMRVSSI